MKPSQRMVAGFTLIELMISLAIGATVTGAGLILYLQMSKNRNLIEAELQLQSNSYFIHQTLRQFVNQAGYRPLDESSVSSSLLPVKTAEESFESVDSQWLDGSFFRSVTNGFAFRFEGSSNAAGVADGSLVNCQGEAIAANEIAEIQFTVTDGALLCTSAGTVVELISTDDDVNVERVVLNWGVDTNNDRSVDVYRSASSALGTGEQLMAVQMSLLLSSRDGVKSGSNRYTFDGAEYDSTDSRLRRESVTTVQLKH